MPPVKRLKSFIPSSLKTKERNCMGKPLPTARGGKGRGVVITEVTEAIIEHFLTVTSQEEQAAQMWCTLGHSVVDR